MENISNAIDKSNVDSLFKILSYEEESCLTNEERIKYYTALREYLVAAPYKNFTDDDMKKLERQRPYIRKALGSLFKIGLFPNIKIDGYENIPEEKPVIYASTHQDFWDIINCSYAIPEHALFLNAIDIKIWLRKVLDLTGVFYIDRNSMITNNQKEVGFKINKNVMLLPTEAKIEMMKALMKGKSIIMYPESTFCCRPSDLHLPFYKGLIDMAKKTGRPIVPCVQEYTYDDEKLDGKSHVKFVHFAFGKPIYVNITDDRNKKFEEFCTEVETLRWKLIEEKGLFKRDSISKNYYPNFIKTRIRDWKIPGNDIKKERLHVYGASDERYLFSYVNDAEFDQSGNLLPTEYVRELKINNRYVPR